MIYRDFDNKKLSLLGFGAMRLPMKKVDDKKFVDIELTEKMVDYAIKNGVNYFDTAYPYHGGQSERIMGELLRKYPRESFYLATKYPGHQISESYDPKAIFEEQLRKCQVEYFDFYLLHNICESSIATYEDERWGIIDYFKEQKRLGRIKHLGFSTHANMPCLTDFLKKYGDIMEFCQIQLNYLDWTLQQGKEKCDLLNQYNIPIWVMEPVRGGKLAKLADHLAGDLMAMRNDESTAAWAFRFLQDIPGVTMILSGMSDMEQVEDNIKTFSSEKPLTEEERNKVLDIAEGLKNSLPCTACEYCVEGCPAGLNIPYLINEYNQFRYQPGMNIGMRIDALAEDKKPSACMECGACVAICPQKIDIPKALKTFSEELAKQPSWAQICKERDEENKRNQK